MAQADSARITATGNIGNVRDVRVSPTSGKGVLNFSLAVNDGNPKDALDNHTTWYSVAVWNDVPAALEAMKARLTKGLKVTVNGKFSTKPFNDADGTPRVNLNIFASRVDLPRTEADIELDPDFDTA